MYLWRDFVILKLQGVWIYALIGLLNIYSDESWQQQEFTFLHITYGMCCASSHVSVPSAKNSWQSKWVQSGIHGNRQSYRELGWWGNRYHVGGPIHDISSQKPLLMQGTNNSSELWENRSCDGRVSWFQPQKRGIPKPDKKLCDASESSLNF